MNNYDYLFKILLIGDSGVGKSSLLYKYLDDKFDRSYISTIGVDFRVKTMYHNNKTIKLQIWDTAGQERFKTITTSYYRGANGIIIAFDLTNIESFNNVTSWLNEIKANCNEDENKTSIIVVGTKADLVSKRTVSHDAIAQFISTIQCTYLETSSLTGQNVINAFTEMVTNLVSYRDGLPIEKRMYASIKLDKSKPTKKNNGYCCYF